MIIGYDVASYSYGTGPCRTGGTGFLKVPRFEDADRSEVMLEILRREMAQTGSFERVTSIIATLYWGDDQTMQLRAGLLDRNTPSRAPFPYQAEAMSELRENVWVGEDEPSTGVFGER